MEVNSGCVFIPSRHFQQSVMLSLLNKLLNEKWLTTFCFFLSYTCGIHNDFKGCRDDNAIKYRNKMQYMQANQ